MFVCVEVLQPSKPNGVMLSVVQHKMLANSSLLLLLLQMVIYEYFLKGVSFAGLTTFE